MRGAIAAGAAATGAVSAAQATTEIWREGDPQCRVNISEVAPNYSLDELFDDFMELSKALTGEAQLDPHLGSEYIERYASHPRLTQLLRPLIWAFQDISRPAAVGNQPTIDSKIMQDAKLRLAAEQLIYLWYVSAFFLPSDNDPAKTDIWIYGSRDQYPKGLLWKVTKSHAPMMSGGVPGYWEKEPPA